jgi:hypothetical protein
MLGILLFLFIVFYFLFATKLEYFASSPATTIQLGAGSGYYPYYRHGFGYNDMFNIYKYPYHHAYPMAGDPDYTTLNYWDWVRSKPASKWRHPRPKHIYGEQFNLNNFTY